MMSDAKKNKILVRLAKNIPVAEIVKAFSVSPAIVLDLQAQNQEEIEKIKVSLEVRELMREGKLEEALKICECKENLNNAAVQSQRVTILRDLGRITEACVVSNRNINAFNNNQKILWQQMILEQNVFSSRNASTPFGILMQIRNGESSIEEIQNSPFGHLEKLILTFAFYEAAKYPKKTILNHLKECVRNTEDPTEKRVLVAIKNRCVQKISFFDVGFYQKLFILLDNYRAMQSHVSSKNEKMKKVYPYSSEEVARAYHSLPIEQQEMIAQVYGQDAGMGDRGGRK